MAASLAEKVFGFCMEIAGFSERAGETTRTFLCPAARDCHRLLTGWMTGFGMKVHVDNAGNLRGLLGNTQAPRFVLGSHLDTVPHAGRFDGILGVAIAIALVERTRGELPFAVEVVGFSEEEGVRFSVPFLGSKAFVQGLDDDALRLTDRNGVTVAEAIRSFGLDPAKTREAGMAPNTTGYLEFHVEQGPVLDAAGQPLGIVDAIVGQSRASVTFQGEANHAGTTPMHLRRDALAGAAEWIAAVEREAQASPGLVATVGKLNVEPNGSNVIPGSVAASLDVRHADDSVRRAAFDRVLQSAESIAARRGLAVKSDKHFEQETVRMDESLVGLLKHACEDNGLPPVHLTSGAGHDAMIVAREMPCAMVFLRSPRGISHHPDEAIVLEDVEKALLAGEAFLRRLANWEPLTHGHAFAG